MNPLGAEV